ncbi:hypothetical protein FQZ97_838860 [compost metagenome]
MNGCPFESRKSYVSCAQTAVDKHVPDTRAKAVTMLDFMILLPRYKHIAKLGSTPEATQLISKYVKELA